MEIRELDASRVETLSASLGPRLALNLESHRVSVDGRRLDLNWSEQEWLLLQLLASSEGKTVPHGRIAEAVWPGGEWELTNIYSLVERVRRKLSTAGYDGAELIATITGEGYQLAIADGESGAHPPARSVSDDPASAEPAGLQSAGPRRWRAVAMVAGIAATLLLVAVAVVESRGVDGEPNTLRAVHQAVVVEAGLDRPPSRIAAHLGSEGDQIVIWDWLASSHVDAFLHSQSGDLIAEWHGIEVGPDGYVAANVGWRVFEPGQLLTVEGNGLRRHVPLVHFGLDTERNDNVLRGHAPADTLVTVAVNCGEGHRCAVVRQVTADPSGRFAVDLTVADEVDLVRNVVGSVTVGHGGLIHVQKAFPQ